MSFQDETYRTAFTLTNLSLLEDAIVKGVRRVKYSDKEIEYRTINEMVTIRNMMMNTLRPSGTLLKRGVFGGNRVKVVHSKGLSDGCGTEDECFNGYGDIGKDI